MATDDAHDRYVTLNGLLFHYESGAWESSPVVVVLHGLNSHSWDWDFLR